MSVIAAFMVPHPPLIIPEVGQGKDQNIKETVNAFHKAARTIAELKPETIVVISPHNVLYEDYFHIRPDQSVSGDFVQFGAGEVVVSADCDTEFVDSLCSFHESEETPWGRKGHKQHALDHGTAIPLYFINQYYKDYRLVSVGLSGCPLSTHYLLGQAIQKTALALDRKTVVIASGDLSHYLKEDGPYGYRKEGPVYDREIMNIMGTARFSKLLGFPEKFLRSAGECGHRAFVILAGALDGMQVLAERLSYEGTFGVGYGVCMYLAAEVVPADPYVTLARQSLEHFINTGEYIDLPKNLPKEMLCRRAGAFVSLHIEGTLRGCIGTIFPVQEHIAMEIMENAVSAGIRDPRFYPVTREELPALEYKVDILGAPERITSPQELDVKKYGVIVTKDRRRGLLLPDLEGVDTPEQQIAISRQKAGIAPDEEDVILERFEVIRHGEKL